MSNPEYHDEEYPDPEGEGLVISDYTDPAKRREAIKVFDEWAADAPCSTMRQHAFTLAEGLRAAEGAGTNVAYRLAMDEPTSYLLRDTPDEEDAMFFRLQAIQ